jgi:restriction system protein
MTEIDSHRLGELLKVVLDLLWNRPDGMLADDIFSEIQRRGLVNEYELGHFSAYPSIPRFQAVIRLGVNVLTHAGWMVKNDKGFWFITEEGRQACRQFTNAGQFYAEASRLYSEWKKTYPATLLSFENAQSKAWIQIQQYLLGLNPHEFQDLVENLLRAMGYHINWVAPYHKDHGRIHIVASADRLGFDASRILVQVRHKGQVTTVEGLRSFHSLLGPQDHGLFVSSGGFTQEAKEAAKTQEIQRTTLLGLEEFFDLWTEHYAKLPVKAQMHLPVKPIYFLVPFDVR